MESMQDTRNEEFAKKLNLALDAVNLSRARLSARLGVDKSLVSRWCSGLIQPSNHNLARIGELFAELRPGFTNVLWSRSLQEFAAFLQIDLVRKPPEAAEGAQAVGFLKSFARSRAETLVEGSVYTGVYALFRHTMSNIGRIMMEVVAIWLEDGILKLRSHDGYFDHGGPLLLLRQQLHGYSESERQDGLAFMTLHGVGGSRAMVMDGLMMSVAATRTYDPVAVKIILLRIADWPHLTAPDWPLYDRAVERAKLQNTGQGDSIHLLPARFRAALDNTTGVPRADGSIDHGLRVPRERSLAYADTERDEFEWPAPELAKLLLG
jgi:transcriptional regulator with XRE-family HTH domain